MATPTSTTRLPSTVTEAGRALEWLPAVAAVAYLVVVVTRTPAIIRALYWSSDAAGRFVLAELAPGHGRVELPRYGAWTSFWWLLATRGLPGHEYVWEATPYVFALATAAIVGWATGRVFGSWAGMTAAVVTLVVGPVPLRSLMFGDLHTSTPFTAAILGAYLVVVADRRGWPLVLLVGVVGGLNAASDPLLWIAGIAPFAVGAGVLAVALRARDVAARAAAVVGVAAICAVVTGRVMSSLGFHIIPVGVKFAGISELGPNLLTLGRSIALLYGANFFVYPGYPSDPLRFALALFGFAALAATLLAALRLSLRRAEPRARAYACYWATAVALLCGAYWTSNLASGAGFAGGVNYLLTVAPAAGVGLALLGAGSHRARLAVSLAIVLVAAVNVSSIAHGRAEVRSPAALHGPELIRLLERRGLTHGYASYWDAQSLTWKSGTRVLVAPVQPCADRRAQLCRHPFFTMDSWYQGRPGRSFLIVDPAVDTWTKPSGLGPPSETYRLGPDVTVYVYPYDLARHIRH